MSSPSNNPMIPGQSTILESTTDGKKEDMIDIELPPSSFSFPRPASIAGSDDSDTASGSVTSDKETTVPVVVPCFVSYKSPLKDYNQDTPRNDFRDWPAYLSFCEDGPFLRLQCVGTFNDDNTPGSLKEMKISRKLLCDHSEYFRGMHRHDFEEKHTGIVPLDDILHEDLMRLKLILMCGMPNGRANIGKEEKEMINLVRMYELADRFIMPDIARLIMDRTREFIAWHRDWMEHYRRDVLDAAAVSIDTTEKENLHRAKLQDFCDAYIMLAKMGDLARLIQPDQLAKLIAECCPPRLLCTMASYIDQDFYIIVTKKMLYNTGT